MAERNYQSIVGQTLNDLEIVTILRYENGQPVYGCRCLTCKATGIGVPHRLFRQGNAKCTSSGHGRQIIETTRGSAIAVRDGGRTASNVERREFEQSQQPPEPVNDPRAEQHRSRRIEADRREAEKLREPFRRYYFHQLERGGHPMTLRRFIEIGDIARERIMQIVERDEKEENT